MSDSSDFMKIVSNNIEIHKENIAPKDYRFYLVDNFLKYAELVDKHSVDCFQCNHLKKDIIETSEKLSDLINRSKSNRLKYESVNSKLQKHLSKIHGYHATRYFTAAYSFYGILISILPAFIINYFLKNEFSEIILVVLFIGFLTGNIWGYIKDQRLKRKNLQF